MSAKDCGEHESNSHKTILICIGIFLFLVIVAILLVWAILRPAKPIFVLQDVTVYAFNVSTPNFITSNFQVTISSRNPNDKVGIYYDKLDVYATYRDQQISHPIVIPPNYQGPMEIKVWTPNVYGTAVPVAPYNCVNLFQDQATGSVMLTFNINGAVRWKVGNFITSEYHLNVKCLALIPRGSDQTGVAVDDNSVKFQLVRSCSVNL